VSPKLQPIAISRLPVMFHRLIEMACCQVAARESEMQVCEAAVQTSGLFVRGNGSLKPSAPLRFNSSSVDSFPPGFLLLSQIGTMQGRKWRAIFQIYRHCRKDHSAA